VKDRPEVKHVYLKTYSPEPGCPIIGVTWFEAAQYCNWLSEVEGIPETEWCYPKKIEEGMKPVPNYLSKKGYRLPTEAECERACRAGAASSRYYGSSIELLPRYSWYLENAKDRTWPVGQKRPNEAGMHDMHGNVWTWCPDPAFYYTNTIYISDNKDLEYSLSRVLRGGSFNVQPQSVRAAYRLFGRSSDRNGAVGVRPARTYD
jgi:formylglycine-generating enzyme required for sulfatase activity